jgi:hypothetical protein
VVRHLRNSKPKRVRDILSEEDDRQNASARTGDSWQSYAWRWALCHLLVNNKTYAERFRALGLGLLNGSQMNFADAFAGVMDEIEFEYRFFIDHLDRGYRVDLCRWDWRHKFRAPVGAAVQARVLAQAGWQPSGAIVAADESYVYQADGVWQLTADGQDVSPDGHADGQGRLEAVVLTDFELSEPLPLSTSGTFVAPASGRLYLRCREHCNELADNAGFVNVKLKRASGAKVAPAKPAPANAASPAKPSPAN